MNECTGNACEAKREETRADMLNHAFHLPGDIANKLASLKLILTSIPVLEAPPGDKQKSDYSSLEAILDDGANLIGDASAKILQELHHIRAIVLGGPSAPPCCPEEVGKGGTKLDMLNESFEEFVNSVEVLHRFKEIVLGEESPDCKVGSDKMSSASVPYVLRDLPEKIAVRHREACEYIEQISEMLLT